MLKKLFKKRSKWCHKGDFGNLLVVGGSRTYSGSLIFNAMAAYRAGCDLVTIIAPERAANIAAAYSPDIIAIPLEGDYLNRYHLEEVISLMSNADAMVIGGGLCRKKETMSLVKAILKAIKIPCVIDADAIYAVKAMLNSRCIITPHAREFQMLTGNKPNINIKQRKELVLKAAKQFGCTILLKGHIDVISDGKRIAENHTGNVYMTKGGTGDTLAGIAGALLARGIGSYEAACGATYVNGKAGDLAAKRLGEAMLASDLLDEIGSVVKGV